MSKDFAIYLPQAESENPWELDILGAGSAAIAPGSPYPPQSHPTDHVFDWSRGRVLDEFQTVLVTAGAGNFESEKSESLTLQAPFLFVVFPGVWHRYRPLPESGWQEHWVAFRGALPERLLHEGTLSATQPLFRCGHNESLLTQFQLIQDEVESEAFGFRSVAATALMQILALALSLPQRREEENHPMRDIVRQACVLMRERAHSIVAPEALAAELKVGYTYFRRMFRRYTGLSPKRYHSQLRLQRAKRLLSNSSRSVAEIADSLSFNSAFHFSNWFKKETGFAPKAWRQNPQS